MSGPRRRYHLRGGRVLLLIGTFVSVSGRWKRSTPADAALIPCRELPLIVLLAMSHVRWRPRSRHRSVRRPSVADRGAAHRDARRRADARRRVPWRVFFPDRAVDHGHRAAELAYTRTCDEFATPWAVLRARSSRRPSAPRRCPGRPGGRRSFQSRGSSSPSWCPRCERRRPDRSRDRGIVADSHR